VTDQQPEEDAATPYDLLGGREAVMGLAQTFYDVMQAQEPALAALHRLDAQGHVHPTSRARFGLFLVGWLGGPDDYIAAHGHPRLRLRHAQVPVGTTMRDAWLRAMGTALDRRAVQGEVRRFLDQRFAEVADFMRNLPGA
jgi:hemoglobin